MGYMAAMEYGIGADLTGMESRFTAEITGLRADMVVMESRLNANIDAKLKPIKEELHLVHDQVGVLTVDMTGLRGEVSEIHTKVNHVAREVAATSHETLILARKLGEHDLEIAKLKQR
jgi:hypothetical protein